MATAKKNRLFVRSLKTIGFVDKGDDPKAELLIFKRHEAGEVKKGVVQEDGKFCAYDAEGNKLGAYDSKEEAEAALKAPPTEKEKGGDDGSTTEEQPMFDVKKLDATAQAEFTKLTDQVATLTAKVAELTPPEPVKLPADVQKKLDDAADEVRKAHERIEKLEDQREVERYVGIAKSLGMNADDFATPLRKIAKALTKEEFAAFEKHEKALQAQIKAGALYSKIGIGGGGAATEAQTELQAAVAEVRKAKPELTVEQATGEVMKDNVALRNRLEAERLARTTQPQGE